MSKELKVGDTVKVIMLHESDEGQLELGKEYKVIADRDGIFIDVENYGEYYVLDEQVRKV